MFSERAKGAEKASCGEADVQTGVFWRVRFFSAPVRFALKTPENLKWEAKKRTLQNTLLDDRFSARRLLRSFGAPPCFPRKTRCFRDPAVVFYYRSSDVCSHYSELL